MTDLQTLINIERAFLSSILFDNSIFEELIINANDFYHIGHQKCYECMKEVHAEGYPIDESFIEKKFKAKKIDTNILLDILAAGAISNITAYQSEIIENSKKRKISKISPLAQKLSNEPEVSSDDAIDTLQKELNEIDNDIKKNRTVADIVASFEKKMQTARESNGPIGLKTSLPYLNNLIGAFEPKKLTVIGARPSMGKTALAANLTNDFLNPNLNPNSGVLFDSLEMPGEDIIKRLIACRNYESLTDLKCGLVQDHPKYTNALKFFATTPYFILHDIKGLSFKQLAAKARKVFRTAQKENRPIKAWLVDHRSEERRVGKECTAPV